MIPFCNANAFMTAIVCRDAEPETLNDDYAFYLKHAPAPTPEPWHLRLLPAFLRNRLKAQIAARKYEQTLITMWETSPHLLDDIGVVVSAVENIPENMVAAPIRVIEHVMACTAEKAAAAAVEPEPKPALVPPAPAIRVWAYEPKAMVQGGVGA